MLVARARAGDVVVIAGKGHETTRCSPTVPIAFDDRAVVRPNVVGPAR